MKALVFEAPNRAAVDEIEEPRIGPDEVLIRSRAVGICHSDFELFEGRYIIPIAYPIIPGHEWAGEVVEVGRTSAACAPATPWWANAWWDRAVATTSASRSTAPTPSSSRRARSGCTGSRRSSATAPARSSSRSRSPTTRC